MVINITSQGESPCDREDTEIRVEHDIAENDRIASSYARFFRSGMAKL